jgi:uncharacterized protein YndB with AHSA1/START domain
LPGSGAANSESFKVTTPSDREIHMTRLFNAPRRLVFEAMAKPEHVKQWWGRLGEGYEIFEQFPDSVSVVTSELSEEGGMTRLTVTVRYPSIEVRDGVIASGMAGGAGISYDRLEDLVAELQR